MRVALHSHLKDGQELAYENVHGTVPADLLAALARAGIHDWTIWRSGLDLFHVVEADDFDAAMRTIAEDSANARWQAKMTAYIKDFAENPDGAGGRGLRHVWTMSDQVADEGTTR